MFFLAYGASERWGTLGRLIVNSTILTVLLVLVFVLAVTCQYHCVFLLIIIVSPGIKTPETTLIYRVIPGYPRRKKIIIKSLKGIKILLVINGEPLCYASSLRRNITYNAAKIKLESITGTLCNCCPQEALYELQKLLPDLRPKINLGKNVIHPSKITVRYTT